MILTKISADRLDRFHNESQLESILRLRYAHGVMFFVSSVLIILGLLGFAIETNQEAYLVMFGFSLPVAGLSLLLSSQEQSGLRLRVNFIASLFYLFILAFTLMEIVNGNGILVYGMGSLIIAIILQFNLRYIFIIYGVPLLGLLAGIYYFKPGVFFLSLPEIIISCAVSMSFAVMIENKRRNSFLNQMAIEDNLLLLRHSNEKQIHYETQLKAVNSNLEKRVLMRTEELVDVKRQLLFEANHDSLTGLPNRRMLSQIAPGIFSKALEGEKKVGLFFVDLDKFKEINDLHNHRCGDHALIEITRRLKSIVDNEDLLVRLDSDEFIILSTGVQSHDAALNLASSIQDVISDTITISDNEFKITASVGIALFPDHGDKFDIIMRAADVAMHEVKRTGRNAIAFFEKEIQHFQSERLLLARDLGKAIERGELLLHYQPQCDIKTDAIVGCEALLRWRHRDKGFISPAVFIDIAEENGLIHSLSIWVLNEVLRQITAWELDGFNVETVAINLSGQQLDCPETLSVMLKKMAEYAVAPTKIEFELTETTLMAHRSPAALQSLNLLQSCGHLVSLDDFGTGYSSLSYLKELPINIVKIDRSFIMNLENDDGNKSIINAIIALSNELGLKVVAEGIETAKQLELLKETNCDYGQGYHIARPMPADEMVKYFTKDKSI